MPLKGGPDKLYILEDRSCDKQKDGQEAGSETGRLGQKLL